MMNIVTERLNKAEISFEPILDKVYFLYIRSDASEFLSEVEPHTWDSKTQPKTYVGMFVQLYPGNWENVTKEKLSELDTQDWRYWSE